MRRPLNFSLVRISICSHSLILDDEESSDPN
jgi:hypothetical protein